MKQLRLGIKTESQSSLILNHLKKGHTITAIEALNKYGCFRLAARISDLKKKGHNITSRIVTNEYGISFAEYKLVKGKETE